VRVAVEQAESGQCPAEFASRKSGIAGGNAAAGRDREGAEWHDRGGDESAVADVLPARRGSAVRRQSGQDCDGQRDLPRGREGCFRETRGTPSEQENLLQCRRTAMKTNWPALRNGCLILASVALASSPVRGQTRDAAGAANSAAVISSVAITQAAESASVRVEGEGRLEARASRMQNPDRLVLDFTGTHLAMEKNVIPGVSAPVRSVRLGQFRPNVARVVIDLMASTPYEISHDGKALVVNLVLQGRSPAKTADGTLTSRNEKPHANSRYSDAAPRVVEQGSAKSRGLSAPHFTFPSEMTQPSFLLRAYSGNGGPARPETGSSAQAAQKAMEQANTAAATVASSAQQATTASVSSAPVKYTGEPISVNLKDVDLRDFFRLIHEISGLNVVLDPAVKGSLTIVLRIATKDTVKKEAETARDLEKAQADAVPPVTVTRVLSYAKASSLKDTL